MSKNIQESINQLIEKEALKGTSFIATIYGDSILHRGGSISLSSLITMMELFGFNERAVRTAIFRLVKKQWLNSEKIGRVSYYSITAMSHELYLQAERRIYSNQIQEWNGYWYLILLDNLDTKKRTLLKKELGWLGYASISTNVMAYPRQEEERLYALLTKYKAHNKVTILQSSVLSQQFSINDQELLERCWDIDMIKVQYIDFLECFREIANLLRQVQPTPQQAFQIKTLLIHHYRRVILKDPALPLELLPFDWPFINACSLASYIYNATYELADQYLLSVATTADGFLPAYAPALGKRFNTPTFWVV